MRKTVDYVRRNFHYIRPLEWQAAAKALYRRFSRSGIFISEDEMPLCSLFPEQMLSKVVARFNPKSVLDVGCGTGVVAVTAARAGARVMGLDLTPELLERARENAQIAEVDIQWHEGDVEQMPFEDAAFDVVVSQYGHMFAPRPDVAMNEMLRVLVKEEKVISICNRRPIGSQKLRTLDLSSIPKLQPSSQTHGNSIPTTLWCLFGNDLTIVRVR